MEENRRERRARATVERQADAQWDRPMTIEGADLLARRHGYRFAGFFDPATAPGSLKPLTASDLKVLGQRFMAVFVPEPRDGRATIFADGRTRNRALRRGLEWCRARARR